MNGLVYEQLKAMNEVSRSSYKAGHDEGYKLGYREGFAACKKIIDDWMAETAPKAQAPVLEARAQPPSGDLLQAVPEEGSGKDETGRA